MTDVRYIEVTGEIIKETPGAMLFFDYYSEQEVWLPLSQIASSTRHDTTNYATIQVAEWIAKRKGMI